MSSHALMDRLATILVRGTVRYVEWQKCTPREQELAKPEYVRALAEEHVMSMQTLEEQRGRRTKSRI